MISTNVFFFNEVIPLWTTSKRTRLISFHIPQCSLLPEPEGKARAHAQARVRARSAVLT